MIREIPNILTITRIILIPILVISFYIENSFAHYTVVLIFIFASLTDFLDGFLARVWEAESRFGKMLDPIADKLLVASTLLMMVARDIAPVLPIIVILCREILVSGMREYLGELRVGVSLPVSRLAKIKTATQMIAIILLLLGNNILGINLSIVGNTVLWLSAFLTVVTGYFYFRQGLKYFK
jgi:cardiolipin synthase